MTKKRSSHTNRRASTRKRDENFLNKGQKSFQRVLFVSILCSKYETWHRKNLNKCHRACMYVLYTIHSHSSWLFRTSYMSTIYQTCCLYTSAHASPFLSYLLNDIHWSYKVCENVVQTYIYIYYIIYSHFVWEREKKKKVKCHSFNGRSKRWHTSHKNLSY